MRYHLVALSLASGIGFVGFDALLVHGEPQVTLLAQAGQDLSLRDRVNALLEQSQQALNEGNYDLAIETAQQALGILQSSEAPGSQVLMAVALNKIGFAHYQQGNYAPALEAFQKALAIYQDVNNLAGQADMFWEIAEVYVAQQDYEQARENFQKSLEIYRELDNFGAVGNAFYWIGFTYYEQENYELALDSFQEALVIYQETNNRLGQANMFWEIAEAYDAQREYDQSRENYRLSLEFYRDLGRQVSVGSALNHIGLTYYRQENYESALDFFKQALDVYREVQNQPRELTILSNIADTYKQQNQYQQSLEFYGQVLELARQLGDEQREAKIESDLLDTYFSKNHYEWKQNEYELAIESAEKALILAQKLERAPDEFNALIRIASSFHSQGNAYNNNERFDDAVSSFHQALDAIQAAFDLAQTLEEPQYRANALYQFLSAHNGLSNVLLDYAYSLLQSRDFDGSQAKALFAIESAERGIQFGQDALAIAKQLDDEQLTQRIYKSLNRTHSFHKHGYIRIAYIYSAQRNFEEELVARQNALNAAQAGLPSAIESGDPGLITSSKSSIASSYDEVSFILEILGRYPEAIESARLSLEIAEQTNARSQILSALWRLTSSYEDLIESLFEQGDYATALANTKQRLAYAERMLALAKEEIQSSDEPFINNIGEWAFVTSEEQRVKWIRRALETLWLTFNDFNWIFDAQNNIFAAIEYSRKALAVAERLGEPGLMRPPLLRGLDEYMRISDYEQALATQSKLFELAESTDGTSEKISAYTGFGYIYSILGRYPEAVEAYQNAIKTAQSANIKAQETTALNNLAVIYKEQGNYSEALNIHIQNLIIARQLREKLELAGA